jgi:hypothetical protein
MVGVVNEGEPLKRHCSLGNTTFSADNFHHR